jgi:hypothetical protein
MLALFGRHAGGGASDVSRAAFTPAQHTGARISNLLFLVYPVRSGGDVVRLPDLRQDDDLLPAQMLMTVPRGGAAALAYLFIGFSWPMLALVVARARGELLVMLVAWAFNSSIRRRRRREPAA